MTVLLVLATFLVFAVLDWFLSRGKSPAVALVTKPATAPAMAPSLQPAYVEGFIVPEALAYHPGHTWLMEEHRRQKRVGMDEFAAALAGRVEKIELPKPGQWVRQGQRAWAVYRNGEKTEMVSPTEGEVTAVNSEVLANPSLIRKDPYGAGWLFTVEVPDEESTARNLVPRGLVREWMKNAVERLYAVQPAVAGAVAADGGRPAEDLLEDVPQASWKEVTAEFFLT